MSGERWLIVNADDFGRSPGINAGIVHCHLKGFVTSTTLMVNLAWTEDAVSRLPGCQRLGVGLHLNFCYGYPVTAPQDIPSLVDSQGALVTDTAWLAEHANEVDIETEIAAQLARFRSLLGRSPTHMDSHKFLHSQAQFRRAAIRTALRDGLPLRAVTDEDRRAILLAGVKTTDHFEGRFHALEGAGVSVEVLGRALAEAPHGVTELMCHPGYVDEHIGDSSYSADREREISTLCSEQAFALIDNLGIRRTTFASI